MANDFSWGSLTSQTQTHLINSLVHTTGLALGGIPLKKIGGQPGLSLGGIPLKKVGGQPESGSSKTCSAAEMPVAMGNTFPVKDIII